MYYRFNIVPWYVIDIVCFCDVNCFQI